MKAKENACVVSQEKIAEDIFSLIIRVSFAAEAVPGQFVSLFSKDKSRLLPRPISICEVSDDTIRLVYRVTGEGTGTEEFSALAAGDGIFVMGPLGKGFPLEECRGKKVLLIGGGIGIPPMLFCAQGLHKSALASSVSFAVGYRSETYLLADLKNEAETYTATEDGSLGTRGTVLDAIKEHHLKPDVIFACGPKMMLRAVKTYSEETGAALWVSMEERMACGIGACLGCIVESRDIDGHSYVRNKRVCKDGPVFAAEEIVI